MAQTLTQLYVHIVYSTKGRAAMLRPATLRIQLHRYLAGVCKNLSSPAITIGGTDNHVHLLCSMSKTITLSDLIRELKRDSSKWLKTQAPGTSAFQWQRGYGAFSISPSHIADLRSYIDNQEEHHKKLSFEDELRRICSKYGVELDERYAWD